MDRTVLILAVLLSLGIREDGVYQVDGTSGKEKYQDIMISKWLWAKDIQALSRHR